MSPRLWLAASAQPAGTVVMLGLPLRRPICAISRSFSRVPAGWAMPRLEVPPPPTLS